jgi:Tfp pilus assembly PilM family ATPase/Tfp pilus assembly protein PilN
MVTLDIEDTSIKLVLVRGRQIETAASLPLEPGLVHDGVIVDPVTVGHRISELMAANGISDNKVLVSISGIHAIYRPIPVPKLPRNLLAEAATREMERVMPVPLNELYTSWQSVSLSDTETVICLVGLPRNTVDAILQALRQAGLKPEAMDVRPLALSRVADERNAIIINAQSTGFDIAVMMGGIPELLRSLPYTADAESVDEKVAEIKEELDRTIAFYNSSHKGAEINTGVAAFISGELGDMLAQTLEYRVKPLPQLLSYPGGFNAGDYAANIGLALRQVQSGFAPTQVNLDVTPEIFRPRPFPVIQLASWAFIVLAVIFLALFGISTLQSYRETMALQAQILTMQRQIDARQGTAASIKKIQAQIDAANKASASFTKPIGSAKAQRDAVNGDISTITGLLPGIINLNSISYGTGLTITGTAPDDTTINDYVRSLRDSGQFSSVLISNMSEVQFNRWKFTLNIQ